MKKLNKNLKDHMRWSKQKPLKIHLLKLKRQICLLKRFKKVNLKKCNRKVKGIQRINLKRSDIFKTLL
jgi:hypothetical protein